MKKLLGILVAVILLVGVETVQADITTVVGVPAVSNVKTYMGGDVNAQTQASGGAGVTCNWALGSTCVITAHADGGATTVTMTNPVDGQVYRIYVVQGTTPIALPTLSPTVTWVSSAPTFSGTSTKHDAFTCQYIGTTYFCGNIGNNF